MIGGTTFEEARTVTLFNQDPVAASNGGITNPGGTRLLLGGTYVHNSASLVFFDSYISTYSHFNLQHQLH